MAGRMLGSVCIKFVMLEQACERGFGVNTNL